VPLNAQKWHFFFFFYNFFILKNQEKQLKISGIFFFDFFYIKKSIKKFWKKLKNKNKTKIKFLSLSLSSVQARSESLSLSLSLSLACDDTVLLMVEREISLSGRVRTELHGSVAAVNGWDFSQRSARERERDLRDFFVVGYKFRSRTRASRSVSFSSAIAAAFSPLWVQPPLLYLPTDGCCEIFRI
jgi:hypothetical protein